MGLTVFGLAVILPAVLSSCKDHVWQTIGKQGKLQFVSVPAANQSDLEMYEEAIDEICGSGSFCKISFFVDRKSVNFPFTDSDLKAQVADYSRNKTPGVIDCFWPAK